MFDRSSRGLSLFSIATSLYLCAVLVASVLVPSKGFADGHGGAQGLKDMWISGVFVPVGFDDNDEVVVALDGLLPNSCHVLQQPEVTQLDSVFKITLMAKVNPGPCLINTSLPFGKVVSLGTLAAGNYVIEVNDGLTSENLYVEPAPADTQDNFLYAEVSGAHIESGDEGYTIDLHLHYSYTCLEISDLRVIDTGRVVVVLPIMERTSETCEPIERQGNVQAKLPESVSKGRHLLHVRSANGNSFNVMFNRW